MMRKRSMPPDVLPCLLHERSAVRRAVGDDPEEARLQAVKEALA